MGHAARKLNIIEGLETESRPELVLVQGFTAAPTVVISSRPAPSAEMLCLAAIMIALQILDGVFTAVGVGHFGLHAEGNPVLRVLMNEVGHIPALIAAKSIAIAVVLSLTVLSMRVRWIANAMKVMIAVYLLAAIIPWGGILLFRLV